MVESESPTHERTLDWSYLEQKGSQEGTPEDKQLRSEIFTVLNVAINKHWETHPELSLVRDEMQALVVILIDLVFDFLKTTKIDKPPLFVIAPFGDNSGGEFIEMDGDAIVKLSEDYFLGSLMALREMSAPEAERAMQKHLTTFLFYTTHELFHYRQREKKPELIEEGLAIKARQYPTEQARTTAYHLTPAETNAQASTIRFVKAEQASPGSLQIWKELDFSKNINTVLGEIVDARHHQDALEINRLLAEENSVGRVIRRRFLGKSDRDMASEKLRALLEVRNDQQRQKLAKLS